MMSIGDVVRYVPGITRAPGREQSRPGHHPRQQLVRRLLRQRRPRRRAVLPRPLQPRARRGAEGAERDDLRPRRRRRRHQPRDEGGRRSSRFARSRCRAACTATSGVTADIDQPLSDKVALRLNGMYENSGQLPRRRRPRALRRQSDGDVRAEQHDQDHARLRVPARRARRRSRHHVLPGPAGRRRPVDTFYGNPERQPRASATSISASATIEHRAGARHDPQPDAVRRLRSRLSELRARRGDARTSARSRCPPTTTRPTRTNFFNQTDLTYIAVDRRASATRCSPAPRSAGS